MAVTPPLKYGDVVKVKVYFVDSNGVVDSLRFKYRPAIVLNAYSMVVAEIDVFQVSSSYDPTKPHKQFFYHEISNLVSAGLPKKSYIDLTTTHSIPWTDISSKLGELSLADMSLLNERLAQLGYT